MDKKQQLLIGAAVIIIIVIMYFGFMRTRQSELPASTTQNIQEETNKTSQPATPQSQPLAPSPKPQESKPLGQARSSISVLAPATGEKLVLGEKNVVRWSKVAGWSGGIYLLDAATRNIVGWITSNTGINQTSFEWDTKTVFLSRYSPSKKDIAAGNYIIKIKFDGNQPEIEGGKFSVINASQVSIPTYQVAITNLAFSPGSLTLKKGDKIIFTNNDAVTHRIIVQGFGPYTLSQGQVLTFDTSALFPGPYVFYSDVYSLMRLNVAVQ